MIKRIAILFSLVSILLALPKYSTAQTFQVTDQLHFQAVNQSMWGPNSAFTLNVTQNLFNVGFPYSNNTIGSIGSIAGFQVGAQINIGAGFGIRAYFQIAGFSLGRVDVDYPIDITLDVPSPGTFDKGEIITINTDFEVNEPPAALTTEFPQAGTMGLYVEITFRFSLGGRICLGGCINLPALNVNLNTTIPIFEIAPSHVTYPCVLNSPCGGTPLPPCIPSICTTQLLPATISQPSLGITLYLDVPNVQTTSRVTAVKCLSATGEYTYVVLTLDLLRYLEIFAGYIPPPAGPIIAAVIGNLSGSISLPFGASITYTIFSAEIVVGLTMRQEFSYCPTIYGNMQFPVPVPYFETDAANNIVGSGMSDNVPFEVGNDVHITYPCYFDFMDVVPTYSESNIFKNRTYDSLSINLALRAIEFHLNVPSITLIPQICFPRICIPFVGCTPRFCTPAVVTPPINIGFGPLWTYNPQLASITWDYFDDDWEIIGTETSTSTPFRLDAKEFYATMSASIDVYCYGDSTGEATVTVTNGEPPFTYKWSNGQTIIDPSNVHTMTGLDAGLHFVRVTNSYGCQAFAEMRIAEPQLPLSILSSSVNNATCNGQATGNITLQAQGGTAPYTFTWSDGQTLPTATNLIAGNYIVTVSDNNGCEVIDSFSITEPGILSAILNPTNVSCVGGNDGAITAVVNGGLIPYTYAWSTGANSNTINNLTIGTYTLTVTDAGTCQVIESLTITQPQAALSVSHTSVNVLCYGANTGSIDLTITGGTAPYEVDWSGTNSVLFASRNEDINNLFADTYLAVVSDANNCTLTQSITINQPQAALSSTHQITNVDCKGNNTGAISLNVNGGSTPYTFNWNTNATSQNLNAIQAGSYTVTISDNNACTTVETMTVSEPANNLSVSLTKQNVLCAAGNSGYITTNVNGGTPPYTYNWSNTANTANLHNIPIGTYTVTITDQNNCAVSANETLTEPSALNISYIQTNISCFGGNNGAIDLTITGGVAPYAIEWTNSDNIILNHPAAAIFNLTADTYKATVYDANNCILSITVTLTEPDELKNVITATNVSCFGAGNGTINTNVTGGTGPYTYQWSTGASSNNLSNLVADTYTLTVFDAMGCSITNSKQIKQPSAIQASTAVEHINCKDANTGKILTSVTGGNSPYTYNWSNGNNTQHVNGLTAGIYTLTITDANNCTLIINDSITEPSTNLIMVVSSTDVSCNGGRDGFITTKVIGGVPPYTFEWADTLNLLHNNKAEIEGLEAGAYLVRVLDSKGCDISQVATILQPEPIHSEFITVDATCSGVSDGIAYVQTTGGTAPYFYTWAEDTTYIDTIKPLGLGVHQIQVIDARNCTHTSSLEIFEPRPIEVKLDEIIPMTCFDREDGEIRISVDGARGNISYQWSTGDTLKDQIEVGAGIFIVTVTDQYNCLDTLSIVIEPTDVECVRIPNSFTPNGDGLNDTWEIENIDQFSTYFLKIYNKWGNILFETTDYTKKWDGTFNGKPLPSDTYYYVIDLGDGNGQVTGTITIVR